LSGVMAVIGEDMPTTDPEAVIQDGKVIELPRLKQMHDAFYKFSDGFGALFIQANPDDERLQVLEYAIGTVGFEAVELKMAQAAKGIQGMGKIPSLKKALELKQMGYEVYPDPEDSTVRQACKEGTAEPFYKIGTLPEWNEEGLKRRVNELRSLGAKFVALKTGPFRIADTARFMAMASGYWFCWLYWHCNGCRTFVFLLFAVCRLKLMVLICSHQYF